MALFDGDRERRMSGDRVAAEKEKFVSIDKTVGLFHDLFCQAHAEFEQLLVRREDEDNEDVVVRRERDEAAEEGAGLYAWAYAKVPGMLMGHWSEAQPDKAQKAEQLDRLFPLGPPSLVARTAQLVLDALEHLAQAAAKEHALTLPAAFVNDLAASSQRLSDAIAAVTVETRETREAEIAHVAARKRWDNHLMALKDVTRAFLRLSGDLGQMDLLFTPLPVTAAAGTTDKNKATASATTSDPTPA